MNYDKYLKAIEDCHKTAIKVEWLNEDESVNFEFTDFLYDINVNLNVNYQDGARRTCTLTLNNNRNNFPIGWNGIWLNQKFKLWMGVYIDENTPYYLPQGVFCVMNPQECYQPNKKTVTINGVDKWCMLDGTLWGNLTGIYKTAINTDLFDAIRSLLKKSRFSSDLSEATNVCDQIDPILPLLPKKIHDRNTTGDTPVSIALCPYTATVERDKTFADVLLEYAKIMRCSIFL